MIIFPPNNVHSLWYELSLPFTLKAILIDSLYAKARVLFKVLRFYK
jgi:hypothetical protein